MKPMYTAWNGRVLTRREIPSAIRREYAFGMAFGFTLTMLGALAMLFSLGCGSADDSAPTELSPEPQHESFEEPEAEIPLCPGEPDPEPGECQRLVYGSPGVPGYCNRWLPCPVDAEPAKAKAELPIMHVNPAPELLELTLRAAELIRLKSGALVEVSDTGIPVTIHDGARQGSANERSIYLSTETAAREDGFALNSLAHEFVHLLSEFGDCSDETNESGHLPAGNVVSNGNNGYAAMQWTDADTRLACSCGACP